MGKGIYNRAEVPSTFEMRTRLALGTEQEWSIVSLDVKTAFLYAELNEEEDGAIVVQPLLYWSEWDWRSREFNGS